MDEFEKILASLGVILLIAILGVAVVFAYGSYKDLELKKEKVKMNAKQEDKTKTSKKNEKQIDVENEINQQSEVESKIPQSEQTVNDNQQINDSNNTVQSAQNDSTNSQKENSQELDGDGKPLPEIEVNEYTDENGDGKPETINGRPAGDVGGPSVSDKYAGN
ncbi:Uncharacterised protein [Staphylococcus caeli]|uniref:Uncharacterized protein n=1 Tax=Staphylococcus caeli TaxID=2201815 RepID=A0A1D4K5D5_9STAP|nr:Uncharacterised protein [Staphylococcus caeli]SCT49426.1 Uncharacterised protein [Staphylococcus caeli]